MVWCCPFVTVSQAAGRLQSDYNSPHDEAYLPVPNADNETKTNIYTKYFRVGLFFSILALLGVPFINNLLFICMGFILYGLRTKVRRLYNIAGTQFKDCVVSFCCMPCTITQLAYQIWDNPENIPGFDYSVNAVFHDSVRPLFTSNQMEDGTVGFHHFHQVDSV